MTHDDLTGGDGPFPTTVWSMLGSADGPWHPVVTGFFLRYRPAMKAHLVRRRGLRPDEADDLVQGFICSKVIEKRLLAQADSRRGRFRSFLLTALDHYLISERRARRAHRRAPESLVALGDDVDVEDVRAGPHRAFDVEWARQVLVEAIARMRGACAANRRPDLWGVFETRVLDPLLEQSEPVAYERLVERFGFASPAAASNALITARRMFVRHLREVVGEYAVGDDGIEQEIRDLRRVLEEGGVM
ncbi:MAG: hypothetical protein CMJ18_21195 [Phycisphaeraceae bacterium]|nr:hypothetical protein [Phycisphaeraceae bacterium]